MIATHKHSDRLADETRRGQEAFDRFVRLRLRPEDDGKFVAVDIQSGSYEIDADDYQATRRLLARIPGARIMIEGIVNHVWKQYSARLSSARRESEGWTEKRGVIVAAIGMSR